MAARVSSIEEMSSLKACYFCDKIDPTNKRCSRCKKAIYCSRKCQKADWSKHKITCQPAEGRATQKTKTATRAVLGSSREGISESRKEGEIWDFLEGESSDWQRNMRDCQTFWEKEWPQIHPFDPNASASIQKAFLLSLKGEIEPLFIDLGAGRGENARLCLQNGWRAIAVDFSQQAIENIQRDTASFEGDPRLQIVQKDIFEYVFPEKVQLIAALDLLEYCDPGKLRGLLSRIHNSLDEWGFLVISFECAPAPEDLHVIAFARANGFNDWYFKSPEDACAALTESGFKVISGNKREKGPIWGFVAVKPPTVISERDFERWLRGKFPIR